jgi:AraC-like DNA-binding protein
MFVTLRHHFTPAALLAMMNIYDFIRDNASYFDQSTFGRHGDLFIDYLCPITEPRMRVWSHKNCLMYVMQGVKAYVSGNTHHRSAEGEVLFIRKGGYVLFQHFEQPYRALIFMFDDTAVHDLWVEFPQLLPQKPEGELAFAEEAPIVVLESSELIRSVFLSALPYAEDPSLESRVSLELKFRELLVSLLNPKADNALYRYLSWISQDKALPFIKLMRENGHFNFTTEELARTAHMSLSAFKRFFRKHMGTSPGKWLSAQRIGHARQMLGAGKAVSEVAFMLGYSDAAAFSKAFKSATGLTPRDFARRIGPEARV